MNKDRQLRGMNFDFTSLYPTVMKMIFPSLNQKRVFKINKIKKVINEHSR